MTTGERKCKTLAQMAAEANGESSEGNGKPVLCPRCGGKSTRAVGDGVRLCSKCGREFTTKH